MKSNIVEVYLNEMSLCFFFRISGLEAEVEELRRDKQALEVRITEMQKRK
jgi:hypothetical protein